MVYRFLSRISAYVACTVIALTVLFTLPQRTTIVVDDVSVSARVGCVTCVYAAASTQASEEIQKTETDNEAILETVQSLEWILKSLYLLMWPLLAIAGASLDNALVYGEIFFLDTMLWKFWQVIRNFTNFAIGLVFVGSILMSFFYQNSEKFSLPNILKNTFIAGIVVQMSWFLVAVLLDLSTIGVVGLSAMPLNIVGQDRAAGQESVLTNVRYLKPHTIYNMGGTTEELRDYAEHSILYSCEEDADTYYLSCWVDQGKFLERGSEDEPKSRLFYKKTVADIRENIGGKDSKGITKNDIYDDFCVWDKDLIVNPFGNEYSEQLVAEKRKDAEDMMQTCSTLDKYVENAAGMSGPLYLLFAVIMNMSEIAVTSSNAPLPEAVFVFLIRAVIGLALILPLFALCVVLIIRVVILWLIIAFSPVLSLLFIYKAGENTGDLSGAGLGGSITSITDILTLIFLPVIVAFAISMSVVFLTLITKPDFIQGEVENRQVTSCEVDSLSLLGCELDQAACEEGKREYDCFGVKFVMSEAASNNGANIINTMGWLVQSLMGIAVMRAIIFLALKSSKITAGVVGSIESFGKSLALAAPIIPTGSGLMSVGGAQKTMAEMANIPKQIQQKQYDNSVAKDLINASFADFDGSAKKTNEALESATTQQAAVENLKTLKAASSTNVRDYESGLARNLGLAAYGPSGANKFSKVADALKDEKVASTLAEHKLATGFVENWHQTGKYQNNKQQLSGALASGLGLNDTDKKVYKQDASGNRVGKRVWHIVDTPGSAEKQYMEVSQDDTGAYQLGKSYHSLATNPIDNMNKNGFETLHTLIEEHTSLDNVPDALLSHYDIKEDGKETSLVDVLKNHEKSEEAFTFITTKGKKKIASFAKIIKDGKVIGLKDIQIKES